MFCFFFCELLEMVGKSKEYFTHMCHGQKSRFLGDGRPPTFNDGILIIGI